MVVLLCILCGILLILTACLAGKLLSVYRAADELRREFPERLNTDTNVGLDLSTADRKMNALAAELNQQLKLLRKEHIRYVNGDERLKRAMTNVAHDLRTPLTAICGYLDLLAEEEMSETAKAYLAIIENRVFTLKELTGELFQHSVMLSPELSGEWAEISLNRALEECIAAYYGAFKKAGIIPKICMPQDRAVTRRLNPKALSRILSNIVSNAIKYSDGDFSASLEENGTFCFSNHAEKLDQIQVGHLFERFFTVENGRNANGLGLSIAKTLTEEMGGRMDAKYREDVLSIRITFEENR